MYISCEKCKYDNYGQCYFYIMGSGNEIDMPCYREKELIRQRAESKGLSITKEEAVKLLVNATYSDEWQGNEDLTTANNMAIEALNILEEFEKAHIITGGRLNGRTYAYKCGLEDGKRKALEQKPCKDCISREEAIRQIQRYGVGCFDADDFSVETATRFVISKLNELNSVESDKKYKEFVEWVAEEIFDEDFDDYFDNYYFFQTACRKLEKFGIVKLIDGYWVFVGSEKKNGN